MTTGEIIYAAAGVVIGFVLGALTLYFMRRATVATERQAGAAERSAPAAESMMTPKAPPVVWTISPTKGKLYELRNVGAQTATEVTVTLLPAGTEGLLRYPPDGPIGAGEAHEIGVLSAGGLKATSAKIECAELSKPVVLAL